MLRKQKYFEQYKIEYSKVIDKILFAKNLEPGRSYDLTIKRNIGTYKDGSTVDELINARGVLLSHYNNLLLFRVNAHRESFSINDFIDGTININEENKKRKVRRRCGKS